jgi:predicted nucleic acid-binding protein
VIVLDASALTDWLLQTPTKGSAIARQMRAARFVHTLDLAYLEVTSALRRKIRRDELPADRAQKALVDLADTRLIRHPAAPLAERIFALRDALSAYDAAYVALAEVLGAPLLTTDDRLARSHGHAADVRSG